MAIPTTPLGDELLGAAAGGDAHAFRQLVEPHRAELHAHCYRMLGSLHDAEDALQDALLRAWRGLHGVRDRESLRPWLYRIATNTSIDLAKRRPPRTQPIDHGGPADPGDHTQPPLVESVSVQPYPDEALGLTDGPTAPHARYEQREAIELAFIAALQHLPATQRAVLILREVLGYSAAEVAEVLDTTVASVNSGLQRARRRLEERLPNTTQQATLRRLSDERRRALVEEFVDAWEHADVDRLTRLLADDATFSMPPDVRWWRGRDAIIEFISGTKSYCATSMWRPTHANGQLAMAYYLIEPDGTGWWPATITTLDLEGDRIRDVTAFVYPELFPRFGLPSRVST